MTIFFISWMLTYFNRRNLPYKALSMAILVLPWLKLYLCWFCVSLPLSLKGVIVHFSRPTLKRRKDLEVEQIERIWLECFIYKQTFLIGTFYRPSNSEARKWEYLAFPLEKAKVSNINNIIITGVFNCNSYNTHD